MAKQVVIASSMTPHHVMDVLLLPETTQDIFHAVQPTDRKGGDTRKIIIIPVETASFYIGKEQSAFVTTRSEEELEDCLVCDEGATCTSAKNLENCSLCEPKVVIIQTAHGSTMMNASYLCYKTFFIWDILGEVRQILVIAYVVSNLLKDITI